MNYLKKFESYEDSDFEFVTDLKGGDVYLQLDDEYDDRENIKANVYWRLKFEWMRDAGVYYNIDVDKVEIEYIGVKWEDDEDIKEEKTLIFEDPQYIEVNTDTPNNGQIIALEVQVQGNSVEVTF